MVNVSRNGRRLMDNIRVSDGFNEHDSDRLS